MNKVSRAKLAAAFVGLLDKYSKQQLLPALAQAVKDLRLTNQLELLISDINLEMAKQHGKLAVVVKSAHHLNDELRTDLSRIIKRSSGAHTLKLDESIDQDLLGGLIASTPELEIDLSIKSKLKQLEKI